GCSSYAWRSTTWYESETSRSRQHDARIAGPRAAPVDGSQRRSKSLSERRRRLAVTKSITLTRFFSSLLEELLRPEVGQHRPHQQDQRHAEERLPHEHEHGEDDRGAVPQHQQGEEVEDGREDDGELEHAPARRPLVHRLAAFCSGCAGPWQVRQEVAPVI